MRTNYQSAGRGKKSESLTGGPGSERDYDSVSVLRAIVSVKTFIYLVNLSLESLFFTILLYRIQDGRLNRHSTIPHRDM